MTRSYEIEWYPTKEEKRGEPFHRHNTILLNNPTGTTAIDAKNALNSFCQNFGGLNKNTIVRIKEFNGKGEQIGEDITPMEGTSVIPEKKAGT